MSLTFPLRPLYTLALAAGLILGCAAESPPRAEPETVLDQAAARTRTQERQTRERTSPARPLDLEALREGLEQRLRAAWWHQPKKKSLLEITDRQVAEIDRLMLDYLEGEFRSEDFGESSARFRRGLAEGDWESARIAAETMAAATGAALRRQSEAMIRAAAVLTPEQRKLLSERFPGLLEKPWVRVSGLLASAARKQEQWKAEDGENPAP